MKKLTTLFLALVLGVSLFAQIDSDTGRDHEFKTVFHRNKDELFISGFGGPLMAFTTVGNEFAHMMGGGGGIQINNLFFGGYGMGLTTPLEYKNTSVDPGDEGYEYSLEFGHGGFWTGFIIARKRPVHLSVSSQFGWGKISQQLNSQYGLEPVSTDPVFVITPIAEVEMNFSHFFKVGIGSSISYLRGPGITNTDYTVKDFANPSVYLTFKFGWFN